MSQLARLLDSFDDEVRPAAAAPGQGSANADEQDRLAAYETGYRSGWEDCLAAEEAERARVRAELARNLSDLGTTYHEARSSVVAGVEPLLRELFGKVLPSIATHAAMALVIDELVEVATAATEIPVEIAVAPADGPALRRLLPDSADMLASVVEDPAVAEGQAYVRFGKVERKFDLSHLGPRLIAALEAAADGDEERIGNAG